MTVRIKKGKHSYFHLPRFHLGQPFIDCTVKFMLNCQYDFNYPARNQINKLIGFSNGYHKCNSVRVGWKYRDGHIELFAYTYIKGKPLEHKRFCNVPLDTMFNLRMQWLSEETLMIEVNDKGIRKIEYISYPLRDKPGYYLFPFFGGQVPAPHDMDIVIQHN